MRPYFSIITVCWNEEAGIKKTCESIVTQSYKDYEWIVIDGASTDRTLEILKEYETNMTCLISASDKGIYDAMNKGLIKASGEYVVFINGGDALASHDVLEKVKLAPHVDIIYGDMRQDSPDGPVMIYPNEIIFSDLLTLMLPHQATYYRRELFKYHGHYDISYRIAADYEFNLRLLASGKISLHHIAKPLAIFDLSGISSSQKHRDLRKLENHQIRMKYFPLYRWSLKAIRQGFRGLITYFSIFF